MSSSGRRSVSVVLATYERADALDVVLRAFSEQDDAEPFEVVIADDGSGESIARVIERWRGRLELTHAWQPDEGFRKARILDLAALAARGEHLLFLDGDCVPRRTFMSAVARAARPGWFLTTKRIELGERFTRRVIEEGLPVWRWSAAEWLVRAPREVGRPGYLLPARDRRRPWRPNQPEFYPPFNAYCLFGVDREDFERVNGYDARCVRSTDGEDQDLAIRLRRTGLRCGWPGPRATVLHLWHAVREDRSDAPRLFRETQASAHVQAVVGLRELAAEAHATRAAADAAAARPSKRRSAP
jgi:glycosyltransferase involved in cell wall biosynthesis